VQFLITCTTSLCHASLRRYVREYKHLKTARADDHKAGHTDVMHTAPLKYKPGTMRRWIEEDNKGVRILGIR